MDEKRIVWIGSSKKDLLQMPPEVIKTFGYALSQAQNDLTYPDAKTLNQFTPTVVEILEDQATDTYRAIYTAKYAGTIYVLHCFKKKSTSGRKLPKRDKETIEARLKEVRKIESDRAKGKE